MSDYIPVTIEQRTVFLTARPVSLCEFRAFLHESGRPTPSGVKRVLANISGGSKPVIGVTQLDAAAYCAWAGRRLGRPCRLPGTNELALMPHAAVSHAHEVVPDAGFWPHEQGRLPELRGGLKPVFLCEWTRETEEIPTSRGASRVLAGIFYPPWLREGANPLHVHARLLATESFSFVTFRVAYAG